MTTITLSRGGHTLASNRGGGHGTRTGANHTLIAPVLGLESVGQVASQF